MIHLRAPNMAKLTPYTQVFTNFLTIFPIQGHALFHLSAGINSYNYFAIRQGTMNVSLTSLSLSHFLT